MVKRSKLLQTLDFHRGRDYDAEKHKKVAKAAEKKKAEKKKKAGIEDGDGDDRDNEVFGILFALLVCVVLTVSGGNGEWVGGEG